MLPHLQTLSFPVLGIDAMSWDNKRNPAPALQEFTDIKQTLSYVRTIVMKATEEKNRKLWDKTLESPTSDLVDKEDLSRIQQRPKRWVDSQVNY